MEVIFTKHVFDKLGEKEIKKLKITQEKILDVLINPLVVDKNIQPHQSIGNLSKTLSLSVIWKIENGMLKVVTFYPASKGRYESKVLRRR